MKIKYISAIFVYFATFTLSVLVAGLPASITRSAKTSCFNNAAPVVNRETKLQERLRKFLEADHQTGIEFANDMARLSQSQGRVSAERIATANLVEKMAKSKCGDGMPKGFCLAWDEHADAWRKFSAFIESEHKSSGGEFKPETYADFNERIELTYRELIAAARDEGVDFKY